MGKRGRELFIRILLSAIGFVLAILNAAFSTQSPFIEIVSFVTLVAFIRIDIAICKEYEKELEKLLRL